MDQYRTNLIVRIAKLHYELGISQVEIAKQEHLSTSTVSRLIKLASQLGLVKITVVEPKHSYTDLENQFMSRFHLKKVTILSDIVDNPNVLLQDVCQVAAEDLAKLVHNGCTIGITWGRTLSVLSKVLVPAKKKDISIVQLNGGVSRLLYDSGYATSVRSFVDAYGGDGYMLAAPAVVSNADIAKSITTDHFVHETLELAKHCDISVYSIGSIGHETVLYQMGYIPQEEYEEIAQKAVGDVCSHYIDKDGNIADEDLDSRVIAVPLSIVRTIPNKLVVAVGLEKAQAILAAIHGGLVDYLYIDQPTARKVLQLANKA